MNCIFSKPLTYTDHANAKYETMGTALIYVGTKSGVYVVEIKDNTSLVWLNVHV